MKIVSLCASEPWCFWDALLLQLELLLLLLLLSFCCLLNLLNFWCLAACTCATGTTTTRGIKLFVYAFIIVIIILLLRLLMRRWQWLSFYNKFVNCIPLMKIESDLLSSFSLFQDIHLSKFYVNIGNWWTTVGGTPLLKFYCVPQ